eukprot:173038-Pyramimonas_sp.AAC.1
MVFPAIDTGAPDTRTATKPPPKPEGRHCGPPNAPAVGPRGQEGEQCAPSTEGRYPLPSDCLPAAESQELGGPQCAPTGDDTAFPAAHNGFESSP